MRFLLKLLKAINNFLPKMNKTILIFQREYMTRVKKKSFLILTILTPLLFAGIMFLPTYLATKENKEEQKVAVVDRSAVFLGNLNNSGSTHFIYIKPEDFEVVKKDFNNSDYYALLEIPQNIMTSNKVIVFSKKQINIDVKNHIDYQLEKRLEDIKRSELIDRVGIPDLEEQLKNTKASISVETIKLSEDGETSKGSTEIAMILGYIVGFLIYMFVFIYGSMVMRGVLEEKQNRIVEVIISSVKPIQLMIGKILGIAAVGLTQFLIWVILIGGIFIGAQSFIKADTVKTLSETQTQNLVMSSGPASGMVDSVQLSKAEEIMAQISSFNFAEIIIYFLVYFLLGYLLYSSLMAAIASAVDTEEDLNQFMMPIQIPLIAAIIILVNVMKNPEGSLAIWFSHIPLTSPIIMMVRIPFGVPWWEVCISIAILALTTYASIWMAAKIYRTGVLMYGKKLTWKELGKWLTYKS
jgi:ABC-2 type transport system permease protein